MNNNLINNKKHSLDYNIFDKKKSRNFLRFKVGPRSVFPPSGSTDPDPDKNYTDPRHCSRV